MRALWLDYAAARKASRAGAALLAAGALLASLALLEYRALRERLAFEEARVAEVRKAGRRGAAVPRSSSADKGSADEFRLAQLALQKLSLRWDRLFGALESARGEGVALLAIEPDPGKNIVKLTAEARSAEEMLDYVERLQAADGLAEVVLANHQVRQGDALQPLRFAVTAAWKGSP